MTINKHQAPFGRLRGPNSEPFIRVSVAKNFRARTVVVTGN